MNHLGHILLEDDPRDVELTLTALEGIQRWRKLSKSEVVRLMRAGVALAGKRR